MKVVLENVGKQFYREWIFRNLSLTISRGDTLAILGANGSGKSTLLQIISGNVIPTEGKIIYSSGENKIDAESIFRHLSFASPYLELIEEFTLEEIVDLHFKFKSPVNNFSNKEIIELSGLNASSKKVFKYFSSGMKQRVKLTLAILSDVKLILLDEPVSNLDSQSVTWYRKLMEEYTGGKTIVICSNHQPSEYEFCKSQINISDYK
jgi:ABC-type multidrug transport system ATPase subunit